MTSADLLVGASALTSGAPHYLSLHRPVMIFRGKEAECKNYPSEMKPLKEDSGNNSKFQGD